MVEITSTPDTFPYPGTLNGIENCTCWHGGSILRTVCTRGQRTVFAIPFGALSFFLLYGVVLASSRNVSPSVRITNSLFVLFFYLVCVCGFIQYDVCFGGLAQSLWQLRVDDRVYWASRKRWLCPWPPSRSLFLALSFHLHRQIQVVATRSILVEKKKEVVTRWKSRRSKDRGLKLATVGLCQ
jgi:hypothetical protein